MSILALTAGLALAAAQEPPPFVVPVMPRELVAQWPTSDALLQPVAVTSRSAYFVLTGSAEAGSLYERSFDLLELLNEPVMNRGERIEATVARLTVYCDRRTVRLVDLAGYNLQGQELVRGAELPERPTGEGSPFDLAARVVCPGAPAQPSSTSVVGPEAAIALANESFGRP